MTTRARIIKGGKGAISLQDTRTSLSENVTPRIVSRDIVMAHDEAKRIANDAIKRATMILAHAELTSANAAEKAANDARAEESAKLAAAWLKIHRERESRADGDLDRAIDLAVLLAERLLGDAIEREPQRIAALARQSLAEAKGARRASFDANPLDVAPLRANLVGLGIDASAIDVREDDTLPRGSLRVHTDLGTLDARITVQLERLAKALRDAVRT
jgi:flagellar biosynthesis/type III secretory pathway protein FliH